MLWKLTPAAAPVTRDVPVPDQGRFVLHRHIDAQGPHLDLRLEAGRCLLGWRVDGADLSQDRWAIEKAPHPVYWLERDGDAVRVDSGTYAWHDQDDDGGMLELRGARTTQWLRVAYQAPPPAALGAVVQLMQAHKLDPAQVPDLLLDGRAARDRALARLCALGRELDGTTFDEASWRALLRDASLDQIHQHLRAYEVRFDAKYPPAPISRPEPLPEEDTGARHDAAWAIVQGA
jgi:hypothetical protein